MNVVVNTKPTFAQLTSSVFGLFYCGGYGCLQLCSGWMLVILLYTDHSNIHADLCIYICMHGQA
jgi:hypothetical protein